MKKAIRLQAKKVQVQENHRKTKIILRDFYYKIIEDQLKQRETSKYKFLKREKAIDSNYLKESQLKKKNINNLQLLPIKNHSKQKILSFQLLLLKNNHHKKMRDFK